MADYSRELKQLLLEAGVGFIARVRASMKYGLAGLQSTAFL